MQPATPSRSLSFARMVAREGYPVMTFAEFQATGHDVADLASIDAAQGFCGPGRAYLDDGLFLERGELTGLWYVTIGNYQSAAFLLESAERKLYEFAVSEGYINE